MFDPSMSKRYLSQMGTRSWRSPYKRCAVHLTGTVMVSPGTAPAGGAAVASVAPAMPAAAMALNACFLFGILMLSPLSAGPE